MLKEPYKRDPTTPRVVYLRTLDLGGLIGVRLHSLRSCTVSPRQPNHF
jgi:hypothetical protein